MSKKFFLGFILLTATLPVNASSEDILKVTSFTLDNGLTVWLNEDHSSPKAFGAILVKAGAKDCPGTGIAHYFEHIMFKGTDKFGTTDYAAEKPYLDSIAVLYDRLAGTKDASGRDSIQMEINRLNIAGSKYVIPNEFDALSTLCGASQLNAATSYDYTIYYSDFIPQYFEQWAELNSERIINPVFRMFQSELETVYEEKNMYADNMLRSALEEILKYGFKGTPYEDPIIGTTDNLKNPELSRMKEFFNTYYVAGNMGLLLSGDFDTENVKPVIEKTFGRIRKGIPEGRKEITQTDFPGTVRQELLLDIPIVQAEAFFYKAPAIMKKDYWEFQLMTELLTNSEGVGLLDKLFVEQKVMTSAAEHLSFAEVGGFLVYVIPKLIVQSAANAEKLVMDVIGQLKKGDFDDSLFESCKLSFMKGISEELETTSSRATMMIDPFCSGMTWEEYLHQIESIKSITKEDIIRVANRYLNDDRIVFYKKKGKTEKDNLQKPPYEKVTPESKDSTSSYAGRFMEINENTEKQMPELDFEAEVSRTQITPLINLYSSANPANDIFNLDIKFLRGTIAEPAVERLAAYANALGTNDKSYNELYRGLQELGGVVNFRSTKNSFILSITGYDSSFEETFALASTLFKDIKGDKKHLRSVIDDEKMAVISSRRDVSSLAEALFFEAACGDKSPYLSDKGKADDRHLLGLWQELQTVQCDILYSGNLSPEQVSKTISEYMDVDAVVIPSDGLQERVYQKYSNSEVHFINKADASQTMIYAYIPTGSLPDLDTRARAQFLNSYLGEGMASILFQEIREFRSMAYSTSSDLYIPEWKNREQGGFLLASAGTQCDKAIDVMQVMDSLLRNLPVRAQKIKEKKIEFYNELFHSYPDFRKKTSTVESYILNGLEREDKAEKLSIISSLTEEELKSFADSFLSGRPIVWCVVGNARKMDMEGLKSFGKMKELKPSDVIL